MGPAASILKPLPRFPGVSRGNYCNKSDPRCDHPLYAAAHDMGPQPFNPEEARSQRCVFAGKFVSFVYHHALKLASVYLMAWLTGELQYLHFKLDTNSVHWQHQRRRLYV